MIFKMIAMVLLIIVLFIIFVCMCAWIGNYFLEKSADKEIRKDLDKNFWRK